MTVNHGVVGSKPSFPASKKTQTPMFVEVRENSFASVQQVSHTVPQLSWLERQPVTLEARGSSPLGIAIWVDRIAAISGDCKSPASASLVRVQLCPPKWSVSEAVNTRDFHSRSMGSNPVQTTICTSRIVADCTRLVSERLCPRLFESDLVLHWRIRQTLVFILILIHQ